MLTPADLRNPKRQSGYEHVGNAAPGPNGHPCIGPRWRAEQGANKAGRKRWWGPTRRDAAVAAQDYCDFVNGQQLPKGRMLKRANHPVRRLPVTRRNSRTSHTLPRKAQPRRLIPLTQGSVYLIGMKGHTDVVKVGFSKQSGFPRLNELQTGNPYLLVGIAEFAGTLRDEYDLHVRYEPDNVLNEWFTVTPELLSEFDLTEAEFEAAVA